MEIKEKNKREKLIKQIRVGLEKELEKMNIKRVNEITNEVEIDDSLRIKLPKEYAEEILFDSFENEKHGTRYKMFAIRKDLHKIDLSEISLEDYRFGPPDYRPLDLSYSNLKIDFSKTYNAKNNYSTFIWNTDFDHMDLSNIDFEVFHQPGIIFNCCDLSNTKLHIKEDTTSNVKFNACDLTGNDLSNIKLCFNKEGIGAEYTDPHLGFTRCKLINTGLHIDLPLGLSEDSKEMLKRLLVDGKLDGCYLNDKKVLSKEEWVDLKIKAQKEFKNYIDEEAKRVLEDIHNQATKHKKVL
jgi:uncharacterized protein YjbI with pentapeptide repeats